MSLPRERFPDLIKSGRKSSRSDDADSILPSLCLRWPPAPLAKSFSPRRRRHPLSPAKILCPVMAMAQRSVSTSGEIDYPSRLISPQTNSNGLAVTFPVLRARLARSSSSSTTTTYLMPRLALMMLLQIHGPERLFLILQLIRLGPLPPLSN
ncbi:hypothetical protein VPH35_096610 [Triticum aestivum]